MTLNHANPWTAERMHANPEHHQHGTEMGYFYYGCRCDRCKKALSDGRRRRSEATKERLRKTVLTPAEARELEAAFFFGSTPSAALRDKIHEIPKITDVDPPKPAKHPPPSKINFHPDRPPKPR